ncbi:MAG: Radical domain protein [Bacteroidetes bacterium]|nr:Radical domain protein [Bacteroidota bacterium]
MPKRFKKIYIEITNRCNYHCSFCFDTRRPGKFMSYEELGLILNRIRPFTDFIYLHVLGEPLLHPHLGQMLQLADESGLQVNLTTNGSLLQKQQALLTQHPVRQINISLHDAEENIASDNWKEFIENTLNIACELSLSSYISFRLWNQTNPTSKDFNEMCFSLIKDRFQIQENISGHTGRNVALAPNIWLQLAPRFEWVKNEKATEKNCYGMRDQIAILSDGSVVPCCIDADASILLGNIFTDQLSDILKSERAQHIKNGFEQHKAVEPYCQTCGFRVD